MNTKCLVIYSCLNSISYVLQFSLYKSYILLVKFIPKYSILCYYKCHYCLLVFLDCSLLVYRNASSFCCIQCQL